MDDQDTRVAPLRQQAHRDTELRGRGGHREAAGERVERCRHMGDHGPRLLLQLQRPDGGRLRPASGRDSRGCRLRGGAGRADRRGSVGGDWSIPSQSARLRSYRRSAAGVGRSTLHPEIPREQNAHSPAPPRLLPPRGHCGGSRDRVCAGRRSVRAGSQPGYDPPRFDPELGGRDPRGRAAGRDRVPHVGDVGRSARVDPGRRAEHQDHRGPGPGVGAAARGPGARRGRAPAHLGVSRRGPRPSGGLSRGARAWTGTSRSPS